MRCTKPWFNSGRTVVVDSGFASAKLAKALARHGMFMIGNVKSGHASFPKKWLLERAKERGQRVSCSTSTFTVDGADWSLLAAADCDKQPMALLGTTGTTTMGETLVRRYSVLRGDGTSDVVNMSLEQWHIHATYRENFKWVDMHNNKRQGAVSFEDTWKSHCLFIREFQTLFEIAGVNAYLLWRRFKPGQEQCTSEMFRRRLTHQLLHHPVLMREIGERDSVAARADWSTQWRPTAQAAAQPRPWR